MNADKESPSKSAMLRRQQAENALLAQHQGEYAYRARQEQPAEKIQPSGESNSTFSESTPVPAVHGANPAFSDGSEQMHQQLKESINNTGDLNHPETQQKEKEYQKSLSISELRDYNDIKSVNTANSRASQTTGSLPVAETPAITDAPQPQQELTVNPASSQTADSSPVPEITAITNAPQAQQESNVNSASIQTTDSSPVAEKTAITNAPQPKQELNVNPVSSQTTDSSAVAETPAITDAPQAPQELTVNKETTQQDTGISVAEDNIAPGVSAQPNIAKEPASYLDITTSEEILATSITAINVMATNTATTKPASLKIKESESAQATPQSENQGVSNTSKVDSLAEKKVPQKSGDSSKRSLSESVDKAIPKTKKGIQEFKENNKSAQISKALVKQVSSNVSSVRQDFGGIEQKTTAARGKAGTPLPAPEQAKNTPVNFKGELVPTIKKEAYETKQYIDETASEMAKEGITQQQLDMVDSGDLAEAKKAKKELENNATKLPSEAEKTHANEKKAVNSQLKEAETTSRGSMHNDRNQLLKQTGNQQTKAKTDLEKKRDEVYKNINSRYDNCKAKITKKLDDLEKTSLAAFDAAQNLATIQFERTVNKRVDAFFDKRYSGWRGIGNWFSDIGVNDDDFAEVKKIFKEERNAYITKIDGFIDKITLHSNSVIKECKDELGATKKSIADYVKTLSKSLQDIGKKAQGEVNQKLQQLDREIEQRRKKLENQLVEKRKAAIASIDKKIAAMREKMKSTLNKIGAFLKDAAKKFFRWALESLGLDAETFMATLQKAGKAIMAIFKDPGKFFSNLVEAVKGSINDFMANFKKYLTEALFDWLMGTIGSVVTLPDKWDVKGIISVILQLAGISWAYIRKKLVDIFGEEKVAYAEEKVAAVKEIVERFLKDGVIGIWEWIKEQAENMMTTVIEGIKDWLLTKLVVGFAEWIVSLLIPGGGIMKLIQGIYKLVMWFIDNIDRIMRWVSALVNSVGNIALGAIPAAVGFIVDAMKTMIPVILDFFAKLLNINGIIDAIQKVIDRIMAPIHRAIDKAVDWIKGKIIALVKKIRGGNDGSETEQHEENQHEETGNVYSKAFSMAGESHHIYLRENPDGLEATMASKNEDIIRRKFSRAIQTIENYNAEIAKHPELKTEFNEEIKPLMILELDDFINNWVRKIDKLNSKGRESVLENPAAKSQIEKEVNNIIDFLTKWGGDHGIQDMTPEAILERIEIAKIAIWKGKQIECEKVLSKYTATIKELDPKAEFKYRGSLAKGLKYDKKTEKHIDFNPNRFDVDAFVTSNKLWEIAHANHGRELSRYTSKQALIPELTDIVNKLSKELMTISGMKPATQDMADFDIYVNSESYTNSLFKKEKEKHVSINEKKIDGMDIASLSNEEVRKWYLNKEKEIPNLINTNKSLEAQAKEAFKLRNKFRTEARQLMSDLEKSVYLEMKESNLTWEGLVSKTKLKGFSGDDVYIEIIASSQRSRTSVNQKFNLS